jgi:hypothetical protein
MRAHLDSALLGETRELERAQDEPTFIARSNSEPSLRPRSFVRYLRTCTFLFLSQIGWIRLVYSKLVRDGSGSGIKTGGPLKVVRFGQDCCYPVSARIAAVQFRPPPALAKIGSGGQKTWIRTGPW